MISPAIDYFAANLPYRPYHANELLYGLRIDKAAKAVLARYIQHNPPHAMYWLVFDVDRPVAAIDWNDLNAPTPNFTVKNPVNGHAHLFYGLKTAVRVAKDGSTKAIEFAAAVERGLRDKLKSDIGYAGLICKMKWFTEFGHLNRGDMLTSEQHRCHNEKKKFQRRV